MTDEEIIKALELCNRPLNAEICEICPLCSEDECLYELKSNALKLINRYRAKITELESKIVSDDELLGKRLQEAVNVVDKANQRYIDRLEAMLKTVKVEAYKEFTDRLKEKIWDVDCRCGYVQVVDMGDIDETLKEMVGN